MRENTAGSIGSVIGGCVGIALGIPIGGYLYDTPGAWIGAIVFGVTGGVLAERAMISAEQSLEEALLANS